MRHLDPLIPSANAGVGTALVLEAPAGSARAAVLDAWLDQARNEGRRTLHISGNVDQRGIWAGLDQLLWSVVPGVRQRAPQLVERHAYELCLVLPTLRREIEIKNPCLTDVANDEEKVRNYPNDRAYRSLHGLIDFLDTWNTLDSGRGWAIAIDRFDECTSLVWRFYAELLRRRGERLGLTLLLAVQPGGRAESTRCFEPNLLSPSIHLDIPSGSTADSEVSGAEAARVAADLEARIGDDHIEWSLHIPRLVSLWQRSASPARAWPWLVRAVNEYDHAGLYEAAVRFAPALEADLDALHASDPGLHALAVLNLFFCYAALGQPERAHELLVTHGLPKVRDPQVLVEIHYFMGMLFARFLRRRDLERADEHLEQALALVPRLDVSEARRHFLNVFLRNGVAYVRFRQGRAEEAIALCDSGLRELDVALRPGEHHLHRSVLLYNAAQVLGALGRYDDAITQLTRAMRLDPNYSEYYLERGGLLLRAEHFEAAEQDLLRAIELSPPYAEVWTDLGQCYRACGRMAEAEQAYSRALDLDPRVALAWIGRAEARAASGELELAIADYTAALTLDPAQPLVLAGRAVAHFEAGAAREAVADLDQAVHLQPELPELYQNRAVALLALGEVGRARCDLDTYLQLRPDAEDRPEVERQLLDLAA
ncbi:MAG: tetratricopeptide repeat protein [Chloroflexi bacterium]|nr:tetratricopeptide repeat protein [Chloroflexota bacterium]MBV9547591.1 tetratricopeptide repeat protein [Chloroflexota bacterium]